MVVAGIGRHGHHRSGEHRHIRNHSAITVQAAKRHRMRPQARSSAARRHTRIDESSCSATRLLTSTHSSVSSRYAASGAHENPAKETELEYIDLSGTGPIMDAEPNAGPQR